MRRRARAGRERRRRQQALVEAGFQAAAANFNPWSEAKVNHKNPDRGPMLIAYGSEDHLPPKAISEAIFKGMARTLRSASERDPRGQGVPSTKGSL